MMQMEKEANEKGKMEKYVSEIQQFLLKTAPWQDVKLKPCSEHWFQS